METLINLLKNFDINSQIGGKFINIQIPISIQANKPKILTKSIKKQLISIYLTKNGFT